MPDEPPKHLRAATKRWYAAVLSNYRLEEHHRRLLVLAASAWDRCEEAREAIARNGTTYDDRFGAPHVRPEVQIERDARTAFVRCLRELGLDVSEPGDSRPPVIRGNHSTRLA